MRFSLKTGRARSLPGTSALVDTCWATLPAATPRLVVKVRAAASATRGGRVFDVDLFLADILLDDLLVLDHVLANPQLFLDHRMLLDHNLFLNHRHTDLVLADLGLRSLPPLYRHPLDGDLLVPGGYPYLLAVGPHPLAHVKGPGLALAGAGLKLFLGPLHPQLVLVLEVIGAGLVNTLVVLRVATELAGLGVALPHAGAHVARLIAVVLAIAAAITVCLSALQPVVGVDLLLVVGRYVPIVVERGAFLNLGLVHRELDQAISFVDPGYLHRDEASALEPEETHLHTDVLRLVILVDEQVVDLAYLLAVSVVDLVPCVPVFDRCEPVATLLTFHLELPPLLGVSTMITSFILC